MRSSVRTSAKTGLFINRQRVTAMARPLGDHHGSRSQPKKRLNRPTQNERMRVDMRRSRRGFDQIWLQQNTFAFQFFGRDAQLPNSPRNGIRNIN